MNGRGLRYLLCGCCIVGGILSAISLRSHYSDSATDFCDLTATFDCDLVNRSTFSEVHGVPVALVGLLGYAFLFVLSLMRGTMATLLRLVAAVAGLGFALYLAYIEAYVLSAWCLLCIGSLATIATISLLSVVAFWKVIRARPKANA